MIAVVAPDDGLGVDDTASSVVAGPVDNQVDGDLSGVVLQSGQIGTVNVHLTSRDHDADSRSGSVPGVPLALVTDPFAFEVHRPIALDKADRMPELPTYVRRDHDARLEDVVAQAVAGVSGMAVLLAGSSAGKTRACWEALKPLREVDGWRLWHPYDPTRANAALHALDQVGPQTVVWLNETQEYLGAGDQAEEVAAKLRSLLVDPARAPVLVLGTLWPEHYAVLTEFEGSQTRWVLEDRVIEVPETFTGSDLSALKLASATDTRLAYAAERAHDGQITQYLAGAPELVQRYHAATPAAKAIIHAAMDARRMGHRNALPLSLLEEAVPAYLTDAQLDRLGENWLEQAMAYLRRPCKGTLGPITQIRSTRGRGNRSRSTSVEGDEPLYRLADYLVQYGRVHRANLIPPIGFWDAAASHAHSDDLFTLGEAAWNRGLYRDATQIHKNATARGSPLSPRELVLQFQGLHPGDVRPAQWTATHCSLDDRYAVNTLLRWLCGIGLTPQAEVLAKRMVADIDLDDLYSAKALLETLRDAGMAESAGVLVDRVAAADLDSPSAQQTGENAYFPDDSTDADLSSDMGMSPSIESPAVSASRDVTEVSIVDPYAMKDALERLHTTGTKEEVALLARQAAVGSALDRPFAVISLLESLYAIGVVDQASLLADRAVAHAPLDNSLAVTELLTTLHVVGAAEQVEVLAGRAAMHVAIDDPYAVAMVLTTLGSVGARTRAAALLRRNPAARAAVEDPFAASLLLTALHGAGDREQMAVLAERAAALCAPDRPHAVKPLLEVLHVVGEPKHVAVLVDRAVDVDPMAAVVLLETLHEIGAVDQLAALADRVSTYVDRARPKNVKVLVETLRTIGWTKLDPVLGEGDRSEVGSTGRGAFTAGNESSYERNAGEAVASPDVDGFALGPTASRAVFVDDNDLSAIASRLIKLHESGAAEDAVVLAEHVLDAPLDGRFGVEMLMEAMELAGADEQLAVLAERLPASGWFDLFMTVGDHRTRFGFGRDPDGTAAAGWSWEDLD